MKRYIAMFTYAAFEYPNKRLSYYQWLYFDEISNGKKTECVIGMWSIYLCSNTALKSIRHNR